MHFILLATNLVAKMNSLSEIYFTTERYLFPMVEEEIGEISEKMKEFLRDAMKGGAHGMSLGLYYTPGNYAKTEELIELAKVVAEEGGMTFRRRRC